MNLEAVKEQSNMLYASLHNVHTEFNNLWYNHILFTWRWWVAVSLIILPWTLWFFLRKRESTDRLLYAGFFVMVFSSSMDMVGITMNLWSYPITVFPSMPEFVPYDICALPVATMLFIQFFPKVNPLIKSIAYSALASFVFQPINSWLGLYNNMTWKHYYSFPILIIVYLLANYFASKNNFAKIK